MDSENVIVDDKYNIEAAEILANEAQVYPFDFWWGLFEFSIICLCVCVSVCLSLAFAYYRGGAVIRATSNTVSHRCEFLYHPSFCIIILISHFNYLSKKKKKKIWSPNFNTWVIVVTEFKMIMFSYLDNIAKLIIDTSSLNMSYLEAKIDHFELFRGQNRPFNLFRGQNQSL